MHTGVCVYVCVCTCMRVYAYERERLFSGTCVKVFKLIISLLPTGGPNHISHVYGITVDHLSAGVVKLNVIHTLVK